MLRHDRVERCLLGAIIEAGFADDTVPLEQMAACIVRRLRDA